MVVLRVDAQLVVVGDLHVLGAGLPLDDLLVLQPEPTHEAGIAGGVVVLQLADRAGGAT